MAEGANKSNDNIEQDAMLERMLTRLALTEEPKLEKVLAKLLPYTISCLSSPRPSTRQKVMEILTHINKRVKEQTSIKLPLQELLNLFQEAGNPMVKNFSLVYMEMAFNRQSENEIEIAPELLSGISKLSVQHQDLILRMAAKEMEKFAVGPEASNCEGKYTFLKTPADRDLFIGFCLQAMLFQPPPSEGYVVPPAGLSKLQAIRVSGKSFLRGDQLAVRKLGLLNVTAGANMVPELIHPIFVAASVDSNDRVSKRGDELLKRKTAGVNLEDESLIKRLMSMYQGTTSQDGVTPDERVAPASLSLKVKLMSTFTHSVAAANLFPHTLQCVFDCIYGSESNSRLKYAGMEFAVWIFKHASNTQLKVMAPIILSGILKFLDKSEEDLPSQQLRAFCYQAIGQLCQRLPSLFRDSSSFAVRLFRALKTESPSTKFAVQEALNTLASAYKDSSDSISKEVESLLMENCQAAEGEARFCALWWANRVYKFKHCPSRFICMLGAADDKLDVRELALEGLKVPVQDANVAGEDYPSVKDMVDFICQQQPKVLDPAVVSERALLFPWKTYAAMITFLENIYETGRKILLGDGVRFENRLCLLFEHAMASDGLVELHATAAIALLKYASDFQQEFGELFSKRVGWLKHHLSHIDAMTREAFARLIGIVASVISSSDASMLLQELKSTIECFGKKRFEDVHGAICATGYVLAQSITGMPMVPAELIRTIIACLIQTGKGGNLVLAGASAEALGHIGLRGPLPLIESSDSNNLSAEPSSSHESKNSEQTADIILPSLEAPNMVTIGSNETSLASVTAFLDEVIASKENKSVQKAVIAYGHLCFGNSSKKLYDSALAALFSLCRSKVEDILFSVGEGLAFIWGGIIVTPDQILKSHFVSLSKNANILTDGIASSCLDIDMIPLSKNDQVAAQDSIVKKLFDELLFSSRKEERCAGAVWLLSVVTYCGRHPRVQEMLPKIQDAFSHLLGDQDELTQEMASRGVSIVYDLGDDATRKKLVAGLAGILSGSSTKKRAVKLIEDSVVFDDGVLGEKPGGGKVTTYKELCDLANEMGQPDLIYKFMDLANYQAGLNSKRGAAFGFSRIAKQAGSALQPFLKQLVPKLLRYQYDPNKNIQDAMGHIWRSLVTEPKKTIDENLADIMEDLLMNAGSRLWRSRESSCLALADILQGRRYEEVGGYLEQLWIMSFRAMDDIKESVRNAGDKLARATVSLTLRLCDATLTAKTDSKATLAIVLPILLSKGLLNNVDNIRQLTITTVMKLAKNAGTGIRPLLPDLVICMLESLSGLEDQRLNYVELHAERIGLDKDKLDNVRVSIAKDSPMWETLDFCLDQVDAPTLELLVPRLTQLVRSGVGLNTRVGVAKFISMLAQKVQSELKQYAASLLKVLMPAIKNERSSYARRAFAAACAVIVKHAGQKQQDRLLEDTVSLYNFVSDESSRVASAVLCKELSRNASDVFKGYLSSILPIAFVARFDEEKNIASIFEEVWEENTSSESVALQLYMSDIIPLLTDGMNSSSWLQKRQTAKAIERIANVAGDYFGPSGLEILKTILDELPGRLWEGKEALLDAVGAICKGCLKAVSEGGASGHPRKDDVIAALCVACGRNKKVFRDSAFTCLEQVLSAFKDDNAFSQVMPFLLDCCNQVLSPAIEKMEADKESESGQKSMPLEKVLACIRSGITATSAASVAVHGDGVVKCLTGIFKGNFSWQVKQAALLLTTTLVEKLQVAETPEQIQTIKSLEALFVPITDSISTVKVAQVHVVAMKCLVKIIEVGIPLSCFSIEALHSLTTKASELQKLEKDSLAKSLIENLLIQLATTTNAMEVC